MPTASHRQRRWSIRLLILDQFCNALRIMVALVCLHKMNCVYFDLGYLASERVAIMGERSVGAYVEKISSNQVEFAVRNCSKMLYYLLEYITKY